MADNVVLNSGSGGATLATDEAGAPARQYQLIKLVDGTVDSETVIASGGGVEAAALRVTLANNSTGLVSVDDNAGSLTVDNATLSVVGGGVEATAIRVTVANDSTGLISVDDNAGSLTIDNATLSVVGGGVEATAIRVTLASDSTGVVSVDDNGSTLSVDDGAGSLTIDGTVTANAGTGDFLLVTGHTRAEAFKEASAIGGEMDDTLPVLATEGNISPLRMTENRALHTILRGTGANALDLNGGTEGADTLRVTIANNSTGLLSVDDNAGSLTIDNAALSVTGGGVEATALRVTIASDSTGLISVDDNAGSLTVDGTVTANLAAGTNNIGDVDILTIAAGDNNIGNVDVVTLPNVTLAAGTNTNEVVGDAAHDAAAAGNPVLVCGVAQNVDDTAPPNRISAESDATRLATDFDGTVFAHPHGPQIWSYHENSSSALTDASVHAAPGAGLSLYVTDIVLSTGAATALNVFFEESTTTVLGPYYLEAVAGRGLAIHFQTPKKITANTALTITTSATIAHGVDVTGFTAQG